MVLSLRKTSTQVRFLAMCTLIGCVALLQASLSAATGPSSKVRRSAVDVAREFITLAETGHAPWQFYKHYSAMFQQMARQYHLRSKSGSAAVQGRQQQIARQYAVLGSMVLEMGKYAKLRRELMDGNSVSEIPADQRQATFVDAGRRHDELLAKFRKATGLEKKEAQATRR